LNKGFTRASNSPQTNGAQGCDGNNKRGGHGRAAAAKRNDPHKEVSMHISTDRYFRERQRHDLALRMIRHEARTCTIRACTALTDDRIRRLCKSYARNEHQVRRRRGKAPRRIAFFTRNVHTHFEASFLASVFASFGLLRSEKAPFGEPSIEYGELFCDAYETHLQLLQTANIGFEHAWFLLQLLTRGDALQIMKCRHCYSRYLRDVLNVARFACPVCALKANALASDAGMPPRTG
jgi:hypothetical protein